MMGFGLHLGRSGTFEHSDSQCLESERGWGAESSTIVGRQIHIQLVEAFVENFVRRGGR
jgi:hypothetical protein